MPDISMCLNKTCPLAKECYRFNAKPSEYSQAYADFKPKGLKCEYFMPIEKKE
jgi:hypothetical protein